MKKRTKFDPNEIVIYDDYAEIILYDKNNNEKARAKIDIEDVDKIKIYKWCLNQRGYVKNSKGVRLNRFIMNCPEDKVVDHIDGNPLNNRKYNLRICTVAENNRNTKLSKTNTSGYKGVCWHKRYKVWVAYIGYNGKDIYLGRFKTKEEAIEARKEAEKKYYGEYTRGD